MTMAPTREQQAVNVVQGNHPLDLLPRVVLSESQIAQLEILEHYDLWFVAEKLNRKGHINPKDVDEAIFEFKRYMALIALGNRNLSMLSADLDEVWHTLILFTKEYAVFCAKIFGEFIHHTPTTSRTPLPQTDPRQRFIKLYHEHFGELNPRWHAAYLAGTQLSDCNDEPTESDDEGSPSTNCQESDE